MQSFSPVSCHIAFKKNINFTQLSIFESLTNVESITSLYKITLNITEVKWDKKKSKC